MKSILAAAAAFAFMLPAFAEPPWAMRPNDDVERPDPEPAPAPVKHNARAIAPCPASMVYGRAVTSSGGPGQAHRPRYIYLADASRAQLASDYRLARK
jgi:hypothetical protein